jgi:hypothetical protein
MLISKLEHKMSKNQLIFVFKALDHIHAPKCVHMPILQIMKTIRLWNVPGTVDCAHSEILGNPNSLGAPYWAIVACTQ